MDGSKAKSLVALVGEEAQATPILKMGLYLIESRSMAIFVRPRAVSALLRRLWLALKRAVRDGGG